MINTGSITKKVVEKIVWHADTFADTADLDEKLRNDLIAARIRFEQEKELAFEKYNLQGRNLNYFEFYEKSDSYIADLKTIRQTLYGFLVENN